MISTLQKRLQYALLSLVGPSSSFWIGSHIGCGRNLVEPRGIKHGDNVRLPAHQCHGIVSRPICDPILKELEGPTKDRSAYWRRFCKVDIVTSYHYIIVGDTYKRQTMPHENNNIIHKSIIRLRKKHKQKLKRHPPC